MLYGLDSDFCILVMESGASVTIADAMKYLSMDLKIAPTVDPEGENADDAVNSEGEENAEPKPMIDDDPNLPKVREF